MQGRYILKLKHYLRMKHIDLYNNYKFDSPTILFGPLLGTCDAKAFIFEGGKNHHSDPIINNLTSKIRKYSFTSNVGIVLFILLLIADAFYYS